VKQKLQKGKILNSKTGWVDVNTIKRYRKLGYMGGNRDLKLIIVKYVQQRFDGKIVRYFGGSTN